MHEDVTPTGPHPSRRDWFSTAVKLATGVAASSLLPAGDARPSDDIYRDFLDRLRTAAGPYLPAESDSPDAEPRLRPGSEMFVPSNSERITAFFDQAAEQGEIDVIVHPFYAGMLAKEALSPDSQGGFADMDDPFIGEYDFRNPGESDSELRERFIQRDRERIVEITDMITGKYEGDYGIVRENTLKLLRSLGESGRPVVMFMEERSLYTWGYQFPELMRAIPENVLIIGTKKHDPTPLKTVDFQNASGDHVQEAQYDMNYLIESLRSRGIERVNVAGEFGVNPESHDLACLGTVVNRLIDEQFKVSAYQGTVNPLYPEVLYRSSEHRVYNTGPYTNQYWLDIDEKVRADMRVPSTMAVIKAMYENQVPIPSR